MLLAFSLRSLLNKYGVGILLLILLLTLTWLTTRWVSYFLNSNAVAETLLPPTQIDLQAAVNTISSNHLFGEPARVSAPAPQVAAPSPFNAKLKGVFAATGSAPAYAILSVDNGVDAPVKAGHELKEGVTLEEVHPGHVIVKRDETMERVDLEDFSPRAIQPSFALKQPQRRGAEKKPQPNPATATLNPNSGVKIESAPAGSVAQRLGLKPGDVVKEINGQLVTSLDDLSRVHQEFSEGGEVIIEGTRDGKPLELEVDE